MGERLDARAPRSAGEVVTASLSIVPLDAAADRLPPRPATTTGWRYWLTRVVVLALLAAVALAPWVLVRELELRPDWFWQPWAVFAGLVLGLWPMLALLRMDVRRSRWLPAVLRGLDRPAEAQYFPGEVISAQVPRGRSLEDGFSVVVQVPGSTVRAVRHIPGSRIGEVNLPQPGDRVHVWRLATGVWLVQSTVLRRGQAPRPALTPIDRAEAVARALAVTEPDRVRAGDRLRVVNAPSLVPTLSPSSRDFEPAATPLRAVLALALLLALGLPLVAGLPLHTYASMRAEGDLTADLRSELALIALVPWLFVGPALVHVVRLFLRLAVPKPITRHYPSDWHRPPNAHGWLARIDPGRPDDDGKLDRIAAARVVLADGGVIRFDRVLVPTIFPSELPVVGSPVALWRLDGDVVLAQVSRNDRGGHSIAPSS